MSALSPSHASSQVRLNSGGQRTRLKQLAGDYGLIAVFIACLVLLSIGTNSFLTVSNLINVVRQSSSIGFIALGMTFVMITAGIDLSVGSVAGLAGVVAASLAPANSSAFALPVAAGLGTGLIVGNSFGPEVVGGPGQSLAQGIGPEVGLAFEHQRRGPGHIGGGKRRSG